MTDLSFRPLRYRDRWFAYLDLLGFTNLVHTAAIEEVLPIYRKALEEMRCSCNSTKSGAGLLNSWFSDTFIIYSGSDSLQDFSRVESAARIFFQRLLINGIPVRGCLSHGKLYSQAKQNVFIGQALIEAHNFGEALDWLGFCLAPSVEEKLKCELPLAERVHYRKVTDKRILRSAADSVSHLYAFAFNNGSVNGKNPYRDALMKMKEKAPDAVQHKYDHSLAFLDRHA